jgi:membrane-bound lytic murein transglycosylase D
MHFRHALVAMLAAAWISCPAAEPEVAEQRTAAPAAVVETAPVVEPPLPELPAVNLGAPTNAAGPIDLTARHEDLWDRIRNGFAMPNLDSELVRRHERWFASRPDYLKRVVERSRRYMHHIVDEIEKRGMPTELALLPIVESSYNPLAISTARASGLWQFIPSTGRNYKLDQTWWVDERRDIVASTGAALEYLQYIYEMHGDWQLALASYNWGEGAVARAIAKNRAKKLPTDYASLKMPKETQNYVPKLQALKNILSNRALWESLEIPPIANTPYFSTVAKPADMDVKVAARLAEMPIEEFRALNPAHNRPVIKADLPIVVPTEKVDIFLNNYAQNVDPLVNWYTYTFQKTDKIERLAARVGMSVAQLKAVNGVGGRRGKVVPGQTLLLPTKELLDDDGPLDTFAPPAAPEKSVRCVKKGKKRVCRTIYTPAPKAPKAGALKVKADPAAQASEPAAKSARSPKHAKAPDAKPSFKRHVVKAGETIDGIARKHGVPRSAITKHNRVKAGIKPGQTLLIAD